MSATRKTNSFTCLLGGLVLLVVNSVDAQDKAVKPIDLAGTSWSGTDSDGDFYVYTFEADGTLAYKSPSGSYRNGTWKQSGNAVFFEMNGNFSNYLGEVTSEGISGKAWNKMKRTWTWNGKRVKR